LNDDRTKTDQWFPAIAASRTGKIVASWYDRRHDTVNNLKCDRYTAVSADGGRSWGSNRRISDVSSPVARTKPNFDPELAACYHGDYDQIAIDRVFSAKAHILWSDDRVVTGRGPNPDIYYQGLDL
jgi:hypothetical protein